MVEIIIDGRSSNDMTDDELVALNQQLGARVDAIQRNRQIVNAVLAQRRATRDAAAVAEAAKRASAVAAQSADQAAAAAAVAGVDAAAPGAVIEVATKFRA